MAAAGSKKTTSMTLCYRIRCFLLESRGSIIYRGAQVGLTLDKLRAYKHKKGFGRGVSFSRSADVAGDSGNLFEPHPLIAADCSSLKLYPLGPREQATRRRVNGRSLSSLAAEGWDGIEVIGSHDLYGLWNMMSRVGAPPMPFDEQEVFVFEHALHKLRPVDALVS